MAAIKDRNAFMRKVTGDVWERLEKEKFFYTFGDISNLFSILMENSEVIKEVGDVFYDRIINV